MNSLQDENLKKWNYQLRCCCDRLRLTISNVPLSGRGSKKSTLTGGWPERGPAIAPTKSDRYNTILQNFLKLIHESCNTVSENVCPCQWLLPCLTFASKGIRGTLLGTPPAQALPVLANVGLCWKFLIGTNTLAYFARMSLAAGKKCLLAWRLVEGLSWTKFHRFVFVALGI